jgi:hypothetical protein
MSAAALAAPLPEVRARVQQILTRSPAFRALPPERRRDLAHDMVKVADYIVQGGGATRDTPRAAVFAGEGAPQAAVRALAGGGAPPRPPAPGGGGGERDTAADRGVDALAEAVQAVDFPNFVAGLIDGVFNAIVDASIRQMEAYGELLKNVAKSVDEYMKDNVTENQARDYLAATYPQHLEVDVAGEQPKLKPKEGHPEDSLPDFFKDLGLDAPVSNLDEETVEQQLVPAARKRIAMDRQQLLATMVLMGINRLIVTDGKIQASVLFRLNTHDIDRRTTKRATKFDETTKYTRQRYGFWFVPSSTLDRTANFQVETTRETMSEEEVKLHAELKGNVDVRFRSETFPLERMADIIGVGGIEERYGGGGAGAGGAAPPAGAPAPGGAPADGARR